MRVTAPKIDERDFKAILEKAKAIAPFYTPEWDATREKDAGNALLKLFARMLEIILIRLNKVPHKHFVAFLDMMDMKLLPARSARVPVTFQLAKGTTTNVLIPAGTQVAAPPTNDHPELIFETERNLLATYANLSQVFSIDPTSDSIFQHTAELAQQTPFTAFNGSNLQEHILYLGHDELFNVKSKVNIELKINLNGTNAGFDRDKIAWEFWNGERWIGMSVDNEKDFTRINNDKTLQKSGQLTIQKTCEGEISETKINGIKSRWIRCKLNDNLVPTPSNELPTWDTIHVLVSPVQNFRLLPDAAFSQDIPINVDVKTIFEQPQAKMASIKLAAELKFDPADLPSEDASSAHLLNVSELKKGDRLEFVNADGESERRDIEKIEVDIGAQSGVISWDENLPLLNSYDENSQIRLLTAIRKTVQTFTTVIIEKLEDIKINDRVTLERTDPDPSEKEKSLEAMVVNYEVIDDQVKLTLYRGETFTIPFYENDIVRFTKYTGGIYPFGQEPRLYSTFYLASQEVFSKKGSTITIQMNIHRVRVNPPSQEKPEVSWEYWNGSGWQLLKLIADSTKDFTESADKREVSFVCPTNVDQTTISGQKNYWIRCRLIAGDYGKRIYDNSGNLRNNEISPPQIKDMLLSYQLRPKTLNHCICFNSLVYENFTNASKFQGQFFKPFQPLEIHQPTIYMGFDNPLISGPIRLFIAAKEQLIPEATQPEMEWKYWNGSQWANLNGTDHTESLTRSDTLDIIGVKDFDTRLLFGHHLHWIRGTLVKGKYPAALQISGIFSNTTWALQAARIQNEIIGSSDATPNQTYTLMRLPIISQEIWVKEPDLPTEAERKAIIAVEGEDAIEELTDNEGRTTGAWIRWHEVNDFYDSKSNSRHYQVDQALGKLIFGDGEYGMIPPKGINNMKTTYRYGGGFAGNIAAGEIKNLKTAVPLVKSATNFIDGGEGSDTETIENILVRGPQVFKHRNRAVTETDYEWLAKEASQYVARAKCLPNTNNLGQPSKGWVTVVIIPNNREVKPYPSPQLITQVKRYVHERCANLVVAPQHFHVTGPSYVEVQVTADIIAQNIDVVSTVGKTVLDRLNEYFHPLTGGREVAGWEFGRSVCVSEIYALIETITEVDYVKNMAVRVGGIVADDSIEIDRTALVYSGEHQIKVNIEM